MSIITQPELWRDVDFGTPPQWWEALDTDDRYWFYDNDPSPNPGDQTTVTLLSTVGIPDSLTFAWEIITAVPSGPPTFPPELPLILRTTRNGVDTDHVLGSAPGTGSVTVTGLLGAASFSFSIRNSGSFPYDPLRMYGHVVAIGDVFVPPAEVSKRIIRWSRARVVTPRVEQYKIYRGTGLAGALTQIATVQVNFERIPDYDFLHPNTFIDETADPLLTYRYRVDGFTDDGRTLTGNIITSIPA